MKVKISLHWLLDEQQWLVECILRGKVFPRQGLIEFDFVLEKNSPLSFRQWLLAIVLAFPRGHYADAKLQSLGLWLPNEVEIDPDMLDLVFGENRSPDFLVSLLSRIISPDVLQAAEVTLLSGRLPETSEEDYEDD